MAMRKVKMPDTGYIVKLGKNGYGDAQSITLNEINCAMFRQFSNTEQANTDITQTQAYVYLDVDNAYIQSLGYKLEGYYFKTTILGVDEWYIISAVNVTQLKLRTNEVNTVLANLQIVAAPQVVS